MEKVCNKCLKSKALEDFHKAKRFTQNVFPICKECRKNNPSTIGSHLKRSYGITLDDYNQMLKDQDLKCLICDYVHLSSDNKYVSRLNVDHDHKTGKIRGLLCYKCNSSLGQLKEDTTVLYRAIGYLNKHNGIAKRVAGAKEAMGNITIVDHMLEDK